MKIEQAFGLALKMLRNGRNLSQEDLAEQSSIHRTYVSLLERGQKNPSLNVIFRLSDALNIQPHHLVLSAERILVQANKEKDYENNE